MTIPFTKAHGAKNDFLLTWADSAADADLPAVAVAICDRHTGVGADGWMLIEAHHEPAAEVHGTIRLFNSDGSEAPLSGNGTRCAAAMLVEAGHAEADLRIQTGAGLKHLRVLERDGVRFSVEMNMGTARVEEPKTALPVAGRPYDATIVDVGNPQCVIFTNPVPENWREIGKLVERDPRFPNRTNVSFVRVTGPSRIEVLFWERGAGETQSSGTGSTGAAAAALARGLVKGPVEIGTPAGTLLLREVGDELYLTGPAEIIASGDFHYRDSSR